MKKKRLRFFASQIFTTSNTYWGVLSRSNQVWNQSTMYFDKH